MDIIERPIWLIYNEFMDNFTFNNSSAPSSNSMIMTERQEQEAKKQAEILAQKKKRRKRILMIGMPVMVVVIGLVIYAMINLVPREMRCEGDKGSISLFYDGNGLLNYKSSYSHASR